MRPLEEIIRSVVAAEIDRLLVRCHECGKFFNASDVAIRGCTICWARFAFCDDCGGKDRAVSSTLAHVRWFASRAGKRRYGGEHRDAWQAYREGYITQARIVHRRAA